MPTRTAQHAGDWIPPSEVARRLGVSPRTVLRLEERGDLHPLKLPSGHRRYSLDEVEALIARSAS